MKYSMNKIISYKLFAQIIDSFLARVELIVCGEINWSGRIGFI